MAELLREKNGRFFRTVSTFPSATAPSLPELMVGRYADRANQDFLRHVQEFFRSTGKIKRYAFDHRAWDSSDQDLFDLVQSAGKQGWAYAESEFEGAELNRFEPFSYQMEFLTGYTRLPAHNYDRQVIDQVIEDLSSRPTLPDLTFIGLGIVDIMGHSHGPQAEQYSKMIVENDKDIARLVDTLQARPHPSGGTLFDHTDFYIFGDHGMASSDVRMTIGDQLTRLGLKTSDGSDLPALMQASVNPRWYDSYDAIVLAVGSNGADVHVRQRRSRSEIRPWTERPSYAQLRRLPLSNANGTMDLLAFFQGYPGVDHVLVPDGPLSVRVLASGGAEAIILQERPGSEASSPRRYAYQVVQTDAEGQDPFRYLRDPAAAALLTPAGSSEPRFHDEQAWMDATAWTNYPFAPALIPKAFVDSDTTPDFTVNLQDGFSCLTMMHGDHGSPTAASTVSFLVAAGPDLTHFPSEGRSTVRLIDLHQEVRRTLALPDDPLSDSRGLGQGPHQLPRR